MVSLFSLRENPEGFSFFDSLFTKAALHWIKKGVVHTKTVVYVDILLLVNFIISYFLLLSTCKITGCCIPFFRMLLACSASALFSLILIAPALPEWISLLYKALSGAAVVFLAFGAKSIALFLRNFLWHFILNLGLAGLLLLAVLKGSFASIHANNLNFYFNLSPLLLAGASVIFYLFLRLLVLLFGRPSPGAVYPLKISGSGLQLFVNAFYDTGFFLQEPVSGAPVILISFEAVRAQLPADIEAFLTGFFCGRPIAPPKKLPVRVLSCRFAEGQRLLPGFCLEKSCFTVHEQEHTVLKPVIAFCPNLLHKGAFDALFGSDIFNQFSATGGKHDTTRIH